MLTNNKNLLGNMALEHVDEIVVVVVGVVEIRGLLLDASLLLVVLAVSVILQVILHELQIYYYLSYEVYFYA